MIGLEIKEVKQILLNSLKSSCIGETCQKFDRNYSNFFKKKFYVEFLVKC
jgi:hypothetical protein